MTCICCSEPIPEDGYWPSERCDACVTAGCWPYPLDRTVSLCCQRAEPQFRGLISRVHRGLPLDTYASDWEDDRP